MMTINPDHLHKFLNTYNLNDISIDDLKEYFFIDKLQVESFLDKNLNEIDMAKIITFLIKSGISLECHYQNKKISIIEYAINTNLSIDFIILYLIDIVPFNVISVASNSLLCLINNDYYTYDDFIVLLYAFSNHGYNIMNYLEDGEYIINKLKNSNKYSIEYESELNDICASFKIMDKNNNYLYKITPTPNSFNYLLKEIMINKQKDPIAIIFSFFKKPLYHYNYYNKALEDILDAYTYIDDLDLLQSFHIFIDNILKYEIMLKDSIIKKILDVVILKQKDYYYFTKLLDELDGFNFNYYGEDILNNVYRSFGVNAYNDTCKYLIEQCNYNITDKSFKRIIKNTSDIKRWRIPIIKHNNLVDFKNNIDNLLEINDKKQLENYINSFIQKHKDYFSYDKLISSQIIAELLPCHFAEDSLIKVVEYLIDRDIEKYGYINCSFIKIAINNNYSINFIIKIIDKLIGIDSNLPYDLALFYLIKRDLDFDSNNLLRLLNHLKNKNIDILKLLNKELDMVEDIDDIIDCYNEEDKKYINELLYEEIPVIEIDKKENESMNYENKEEANITKNRQIENEEEKRYDALKQFGVILNDIKYPSKPAFGRDREIENIYLGLARKNGCALLVGESGVGKTEITKALVWNIQNNTCPDFLKNRIVLKVSPHHLVAGKRYTGDFEQAFCELMKVVKEHNALVVIDEIHTIYGTGSHSKSDVDMAQMLKSEIEEGNIQIIGTTTEEEYENYFASDALKRRFRKVCVCEQEEDVLYDIFLKTINDLCLEYNIVINSEINIQDIIKCIIIHTRKSCRVYNDRENNPALGIDIIRDAFAYAKVFNEDVITINNFIKAFSCQDRIYSTVKERAITYLNNISNKDIVDNDKMIRLKRIKCNAK